MSSPESKIPFDLRSRLATALTNPYVDKALAMVAILPLFYVLYRRSKDGVLDIPRISLVLQVLLIIGTMLVRTPPVRVTVNVGYWLLAFVATYWAILTAGLHIVGQPLLPLVVTDGLSLCALGIGIWARLSLGKNIGFVPAQRELVSHGAYRLVRHPIYTGIFVAYVAAGLRSFSWLNLGIIATGIGLYAVKSIVEEDFLKKDAAYANYLKTVRFRWIPGLI